MPLLSVSNLNVCIDGKKIVEDVSLEVGEGELHVIIGPNGSGKSTLLSAIMGLPHVRICSGTVVFEGIDVTDKPTYERAKLGIALAHQNPPQLKGVRFSEIAKAIIKRCGCSDYTLMAKILKIDNLLDRDLFVGFSGGERKRAELYLVMLQRPKLALLDEPDSGVDVESIGIIADVIRYLTERGSSVILVSHTGFVLNKVSRIKAVHVMMNGRIVYSGYPDYVLPLIMKFGYSKGMERLKKSGGGGRV